MASVFIDIPGIGTVEAKNAATEQTLRELVNAIKANTRAAGGRPGAAMPAGLPGGTGGRAGAAGTAGMSRAAAGATSNLMKMGGAVGFAATAVKLLGEGVTDTIRDIANVGDSIEAAAGVFSGIPIVGKMFSAVAGAAVKVNDSFLAGAKSGAAFGGSVNEMARNASAAGMTIEKFGAFIAKNSQNMLGFGTTTEDGAKRFTTVSKALRANAGDLYALGYSAEDLNQGLANYGNLLRIQGQSGKQTNAQLAAGAKNYLKEMDALAKITGEERSAKEEQAKQLATDAQFNAAMADKDEKVRGDFQKLVLGLPKGLGGFVKDFIATGTMTTEANQKIGAMLGTDVMNELNGLRGKMQRNERLTAEEQDRLASIMKRAANAQMKASGSALAASRDMDDATNAMIEAQGLQEGAHQDAAKNQDDATKTTDGMNNKMQEAQQRLAKISNEFQMFLANSGILETMLSAFQTFAGFVRTVLMPIFTGFATVINVIWDVLRVALAPAFFMLGVAVDMLTRPFRILGIMFEGAGTTFGKLWSTVRDGILGSFENLEHVIDDVIMDAFFAVSDTIQDYLTPAFDFLGRMVNDVSDFFNGVFLDTFDKVTGWFTETFQPTFEKISKFMNDVFQPPIKAVAELFHKVKTEVGDFFRKFNTLADVTEYLRLKFQSLSIAFQKLVLWVDEKTTFFASDKEKQEFQKRKEEIAQLEAANVASQSTLNQRLAGQAAENLEIQKAKEAEREKERAARDARIARTREERDRKDSTHRQKLDKDERDAKASASSAKVDFNATGADLLVAEATRQKSGYVKNGTATASTEAARNDMVAARTNNEQASSGAKPTEQSQQRSGTRSSTTQESSETLLASLNTKLDQLIKVNKEVVAVNERQLTVQQSMTNDLYVAA